MKTRKALFRAAQEDLWLRSLHSQRRWAITINGQRGTLCYEAATSRGNQYHSRVSPPSVGVITHIKVVPTSRVRPYMNKHMLPCATCFDKARSCFFSPHGPFWYEQNSHLLSINYSKAVNEAIHVSHSFLVCPVTVCLLKCSRISGYIMPHDKTQCARNVWHDWAGMAHKQQVQQQKMATQLFGNGENNHAGNFQIGNLRANTKVWNRLCMQGSK